MAKVNAVAVNPRIAGNRGQKQAQTLTQAHADAEEHRRSDQDPSGMAPPTPNVTDMLKIVSRIQVYRVTLPDRCRQTEQFVTII